MNPHSPQDPNSPYTIQLINKEGSLPINVNDVADLQIEDNALRWWVSGYIDIKNSLDFIEKSQHLPDGTQDKEPIPVNPKTGSPYVFRNDGSDILLIEFRNPQANDDTDHTMTYWLSVHSIEDMPGKTQHDKIKRLYFYDEKYYQMINTNLAWSTADLYDTTKGAPRTAEEDGREIKTGTAIKYLLFKALGEDQRFADSWDDGDTSIFYTSPANGKCIDDLNYLLSQHTASKSRGSGRGVLVYDRKYRMWKLGSLTDIFKTAATYDSDIKKFFAGPGQQDQYKLSDKPTGSVEEMSKSKQSERIPTGGDGVYTNQNADTANDIITFKFNEMVSVDNIDHLVTKPVHLHDNHGKKFYINQQANSMKSILTSVTDLVSHLNHDREQPTAMSMNFHFDRAGDNFNISHTYSSGNTHDDPGVNNTGVHASVFNSVMLSNSAEFVVPGQSWRQAGRFISIDPADDSVGTESSGYHNKVYGQYLVLSIVHRLNSMDYTNKIVAIKPYNHRPVHVDPEIDKPETASSVADFFSEPIEP